METFDWKKFHKDLDHAMAIMMQESKYPDLVLPSETSMMKFIEFSFKKTKEMKEE